MVLKSDAMTEKRADFSRFMVHLTRDDRGEWEGGQIEGMTARENFDNILLHERITALQPHCLHRKRVPQKYRHLLNVCCFTETPLDQIQYLVGNIPSRQVKLEAYGFAFSREFMLRKGAEQVTGINGYGGERRAAYDAILETAIARNFKNRSWRSLAYISAQHDGYDFSAEREYRLRKDLEFKADDLEFVILPDGDDEELVESLARRAIAYICPGWTYEQIAKEIAKQQKMTKKLLTPRLKLPIKPKQPPIPRRA